MLTFNYILSQLCVLVAVGFFSATYLTKKHNLILLFTSVAAVFYGIEYLLLGSLTGFVLNLLVIVRGLVFFFEEKYTHKNSIWTLILIEILILSLGILTWKSICLSLLPIAANLLFCYAIWQRNNLVYRLLSFIYSAIWIAFNIILMSVLGLIFEIVILIIEIIGFIIFVRKKSLTKNQ